MRKLAEVRTGVVSGIHPVEEFADNIVWHKGANVITSEQALRPTAGQYPFVPKLDSSVVLGMLETNLSWVTTNPGERPQLWWGTPSKLFAYFSGGGIEDYTPLAPPAARARDELWIFEEYNENVFVAGNSALYKFSDGDSEFSAVTTAPEFTSARIIAKLNRHLLAFNTDIGDKHYAWCDIDDYTTWTPTANNAAGGSYVRELAGEITAVLPLGRGLGLYGRNDLFAVSWIGFPSYITHDKVLDGIGAYGPRCVIRRGNLHYGFGPNGLWRTDGVDYQYIDRPAAYNYIYSDISEDPILQKAFHIWHNQMEKMLVFFWVSENGTEIDRAIGFNYLNGTWWPVDYSRTATTEGAQFPRSLLGDKSGNIFQQSEAASAPDPAVTDTPGTTLPGSIGQPLEVTDSFEIESLYDNFGYDSGPYGD